MTNHLIRIDGKWYIDLEVFDLKEKELIILQQEYKRLKEKYKNIVAEQELEKYKNKKRYGRLFRCIYRILVGDKDYE